MIKYIVILMTFLYSVNSTAEEYRGFTYGLSLGLYQPMRHSVEEIGEGPIFIGQLYMEFDDDLGVLDGWRIGYIHKSYITEGNFVGNGRPESTFDGIGVSKEFTWGGR